MESGLLEDTKRKQYEDEFLEPNTDEFRRAVVARILIADILKRIRPKLLSRLDNGEQLSDRELAILAYNGDVDERLQKQLADRRITQALRDEYVSQFVNERVSKQLALHTMKGSVDLGLTFAKVGWSAIQSGLRMYAGANFFEIFTLPSCTQYWTINFAAVGVFVMVDLVRYLYLWSKGKITGREFKKKMTCSLVANGLAIVGGHIGYALGTFLGLLAGPVGAIVVGLLGGLVGSLIFSFIGTWINERIWQLLDRESEEEIRKRLAKDARRTLEVLEADDFKVITAKWRKKVIEYHPDKNMNANQEEKKLLGLKFQEVHAAYLLLREEEKRAGKLSEDEIKNISKSTAMLVLDDGWLDEDNQV